MIDLDFAVQDVEIAPRSATPLLILKLRVGATAPVEHVMLHAQIRIEATHRDYAPAERERLSELFGAAKDWDRSLRGLLWTNASVTVPAFTDECVIDLPVGCSYDFNLAATKYFYGLAAGEVPLLLLFSGTIFFRNGEGDLQIGHVAQHKEAGYRLPVRTWRALMERYYSGSIPLSLSREVFAEVYRYKRRHSLASWDETVRLLLEKGQAEGTRP